MTVLLDYGIPVAGALIALLTFYQSFFDKIVMLQVHAAKTEEHLRHLDRDMELVKHVLREQKHNL